MSGYSLGQTEGAVLALSGKPVKPAPDQQVQALGEVIALKKCASIDLTGGKVLDLGYLLDEAVAGDDGAWS